MIGQFIKSKIWITQTQQAQNFAMMCTKTLINFCWYGNQSIGMETHGNKNVKWLYDTVPNYLSIRKIRIITVDIHDKLVAHNRVINLILKPLPFVL